VITFQPYIAFVRCGPFMNWDWCPWGSDIAMERACAFVNSVLDQIFMTDGRRRAISLIYLVPNWAQTA